ncbi:MAG: FAD-dependent oxidoreductase [Candidatus Nanopelagicales bacterium]
MELTADIVVIGSGMGGATFAHRLAERGLDVLVLERGHRLPKEPENTSPEAVFVQRRYKPDDTWYTVDGTPFAPGVHYVVGGNTKVYGSSLPRLRERDFEETVYPTAVSPAWPFTYADLEPYYVQAERLYNVHGSPAPFEPWRSEPYPFPALAHEPYVAETLRRLSQQGVHPSTTAMGVDLRPGGRCIRCGTCDGFPCRWDAKSDAEICALDPALATGRVRLVEGAYVDRLVTDGSGRVSSAVGTVTSAEGVDALTVRGRVFTLAAGAANSAALLLRSDVANSSGLVGSRYMMHNNTHIAAIDPRRTNDVVFQKTACVNDFYDDMGDGYPGGTLQCIGKVQASMMKTHATRAPLSVLKPMAARSMEWLVMTEDTPDPANRISLDSAGRVTVSWTRTNYDRHELMLAKARELLKGAGYVAIFEQRFDISMNSHMCGTAVAGEDPSASVVDRDCRSHDIDNLYVVDSAFFPSSGAQNPALTIAANALRVADLVPA